MTGPVVKIEQGQLLGKQCLNIDQSIFYSFQGIPYAKPPIGELRFKVCTKTIINNIKLIFF